MMGETIGGEGRIARSMPGYFNQQLRGGEMLRGLTLTQPLSVL
ncbi:hypothetical protein [Weissella cibaria]|nr:hypothetical protein [Weissella cibaria]